MTLHNELSHNPSIQRHGPRLGELLLQRGLIGSRELKAALTQQQKIGGHLGTNLLENGAITESNLLAALGEQRSTATVSASELREIPEDVLKLIPPRLARRHLIIPFRLSGRTLHLAAVAPEGVLLVEDEIRMFTSCLVRTHIGLEFRVREAILRHYGGSEDARLATLVRRLSLKTAGQETRGALVYSAGSSEAKAVEPSPPVTPPATQPSLDRDPREAIEGEETEPRDTQADADSLNVTVVLDRIDAASDPADVRARPRAADSRDVEKPAEAPVSLPGDALLAAEAEDDIAATRAVEALEDDGTNEDQQHSAAASHRVQFEAISIEGGDREEQQPEGPQIAAEADLRTQLVPAMGAETVGFDRQLVGDPLHEATLALEEPQPQLHSTDPDARLEEAALLLEQSEMRDDVGDAVLAFCVPFFRRCLLLARRRGDVVGWRFEGGEVSARCFNRLRFPVEDDSVFASLESEGTVHSGPLPKEPSLAPELFAALRQQLPRECVLVPIRVGGRVACYLWADNIRGYLGRSPLAQLQRLARKAGLALEICVLRNRIRTA